MTNATDQAVILRSAIKPTGQHDGEEVEVLYELGDDLRDLALDGRKFRVKTQSGIELDALIEELHIETTSEHHSALGADANGAAQ